MKIISFGVRRLKNRRVTPNVEVYQGVEEVGQTKRSRVREGEIKSRDLASHSPKDPYWVDGNSSTTTNCKF